ncbi:M20 family metallopeptidase [Crocosphaera sp. XPORK-15E]|uniref:M20 family metallopeptidase n=1 Tax=Crocosphaera sp. XPORK-15E TaxID=3110247 RepID=UPI002B21D89C|nr:M20 family metallopeptidase [Crocosphaera sp. XPORK-15E]MEA5534717.1 M20 family metallopeptidase [Crocosphaera sp. XPORK-15E]
MLTSTLNSQISKRLLDYLHSRQGEMVELLKQLVLAESPSTVPTAQKQVLSLLKNALETRNYRVRLIPGKTNGGHLLATPKHRIKSQPRQLLLGHCDTVWPLGTLRTMPLIQQNGKLYGPGVYDMKGGLIQTIFALESLLYCDFIPTVTPVFLINSDEEIGSKESTPYIRKLVQGCDRVFVMEPSLGETGQLKTRRKGVGRFTIKVVGKAAHAGLEPEKGASAILELSFVIQQLFALNNPEKGITVNVGTIDGGIRSNVIAPESQAVVDVRVLHQKDAQFIESQILSLQPTTPGTQLIITGGIGRPPMEKTPESEKLWQQAYNMASELGLDLTEATAGGGSDGNTTNRYAPTLDGLGAVGDAAHSPGEFIYVDTLAERSALLARLLLDPPLL